MDAAIWGFIGVLVGSITSLFLSWWTTNRTFKEEGRKAWRNYLAEWMKVLLTARAEYDAFLGTHSGKLEQLGKQFDGDIEVASNDYIGWKWDSGAEHGRIIGNAISACLATNNSALRNIAVVAPGVEDKQDTLTPYFVENYNGKEGKFIWRERNRDKLKEAIDLLAALVHAETTGTESE